jgi:hypothetical protein
LGEKSLIGRRPLTYRPLAGLCVQPSLAPCHRDDAKSDFRDGLTDYPGEFLLPRHRASSRAALVLAIVLAGAASGCKNVAGVFEDQNEGGWFSKKVDLGTPDWAKPSTAARPASLTNAGPVGPDDLVGPDGRCGAGAAQASAEPAVATPSGEGAAGATPAAPADAGAPTVLGGVALGMTECQTVQRAGLPGNVNISAGEKGERVAVLSFAGGPWPGIYHFSDGRLKEIDRAPAPPAPPKAAPKKKATKPASAKTSQREIERVQ